MAYEAPTSAELIAMFPEFESVPEPIINEYIVMANRLVDDSWFEEDYKRAIMLLACHLMALMGYGTGPDSVGNASNMSVYSLVKSGTLTLERAAKSSSSGWNFDATRYGRLFWFLLRLNRAGPRVTRGLCGPVSGYAKDWPR